MNTDLEDFLFGYALPAVALCIILFLFALPFMVWKSECVKARIYNEKNDTSYTCADFFWASKQINSQTQTINLNQI